MQTQLVAFENSVWMPVRIKASFRELKQPAIHTFTPELHLKEVFNPYTQR